MMAFSLWVICGVLEMPNYFEWGGHTFDAKTMACSYDRMAAYSYTLFFVMVVIGPPLVAVLGCYIHIVLFVRQSRQNVTKVGAVSSQVSTSITSPFQNTSNCDRDGKTVHARDTREILLRSGLSLGLRKGGGSEFEFKKSLSLH